jgi:hypothetical protein
MLLMCGTLRVEAAVSRDQLRTWFAEAMDAARKVPSEERYDATNALNFEGSIEEVVKTCLLKMALRPNSDAWLRLPWVVSPGERSEVKEFIDSEYRARAGLDTYEGRQWQAGLADMLFTTGRHAEGLSLMRPVVAHGDASAYAINLLAIMEKVAGNEEAYARIANDPPKPVPSASMEHPKTYFQSIVRSVLQRMQSANAEIPPQMVDILSAGSTWHDRLIGLSTLAREDGERAEPELLRLLNDPKTPAPIYDDLLFALIEALNQSSDNGARLLEALECWITRRGITPRAATAANWASLRDSVPRKVIANKLACYRFHGAAEVTAECEVYIAGNYEVAAINANDNEAFRRAIEWHVALERTSNVASNLLLLAKRAATEEERTRILLFVAPLPRAASMSRPDEEEQLAAAVRNNPEQKMTVPWSPVPEMRAPKCP